MFYETRTLLKDYEGNDFGFRLRTNPSEFKKVDFEGLDNFTLMKVNGYRIEGGTFNCDGDGIIALPNLMRIFEKMGTQYIYDPNETCDDQGRYNYFIYKYGDKTQIKEIGNHCYEVTVKGNDDSCEILLASEKIMAEMFVKYKELMEN